MGTANEHSSVPFDPETLKVVFESESTPQGFMRASGDA